MTRIAVFADIHGNVPALEAVLADIDRQQLDEVLVAGDLVGRGPQGSAVVDEIRRRGWATIRGNHEDYLLDFIRRRVPEEWQSAEVWAASRWMASELAPEDIAFIEALPFSARPRTAPDLLLIHGSPQSANDGLGPWTSDRKLGVHLRRIDESVLICAHTHRPMERRLRHGTVINVGSVGLPFNRDQRAQYAILESTRSGWEVEFRQVDYNVGATLDAFQATGFMDAGGVTAQLLVLELENARPYLVPFQKWASLTGVESSPEQVRRFVRLYESAGSGRELFARLVPSR